MVCAGVLRAEAFVNHGWYVVGCAFLIAVWGWGLGFYGLSIYLEALQRVHGWSPSMISGAITTYYLVGAALIAVLGRVMTRFGPVATVLTGIAAMALGVVALTVIAEPWQLYVAFVVMAVGWSTMSGASLNLLVAPWFERRRGLALSLAFTGASIGGVVVGPGLLALVSLLGFTTGLRAAVLVMLAVLLPAVTVVLQRRPDADALDSDPSGPRTWSADEHRARRPSATTGNEPATPRSTPLRTRAYWTISLPFAAGLVAQVGFITHQVAFLSPLIGIASTGVCLSLTALAATVGRLLLGGVADRMDGRVVASGNFFVQALGFALLLWRPSVIALYGGCVVIGLAVGNMVSLPGLLVAREVSRAQFPGVVSLLTATNQVTFAFAPTLLAVLRDTTGDYGTALALCLVLDVVAAAAVVVGRSRPFDGVAQQRHSTEVPSMLQLRPNCECCDRDLAPDSGAAFICSFECTFCRECAERILGGGCPNCGGELVRRPARPIDKLARFPPSSQRVFKPEGCRGSASA